ncbi:MAG: branched-chain amino acid ABC transporter permease [Actinobacteria bacterium]|nr:branched-chain amino acid ABC transporter permease [Actinomycetota bacterium]
MEFLQQVINGLQLGSIYALIALGYTMVYGIVKLINFAHGDVYMVGAYIGYFAAQGIGKSFFPALIISMVGCAALGVLIDKLAYKPLRMAPRIAALTTAIGVSLFLENFARWLKFIGPNPRPFPALFETVVYKIGSLQISNIQIVVLAVSVVLMVGLQYLVQKTTIGKAMRAVSFDKDAARLMGIDVDFIISVTFAIGSALAAAAGVLVGIAYPLINPYMGIMPGLKAFVAAVLGGIGNIPGAVLGGLIMGEAETLVLGYLPSTFKDGIAFAILIIILLVRPAGLLGKQVSEKV